MPQDACCALTTLLARLQIQPLLSVTPAWVSYGLALTSGSVPDLGSHSVVQTQRAVRAAPAEQDARERAEHRLSTGLRVVAGVLFVATVVYVLAPVVGLAEDFFREPPFVSNSAVKVALIGLACLYAAGDVRRRRGLVVAVIAAHVVLVVAVGLMLAFADTSEEFDFGLTLSTVLWGGPGVRRRDRARPRDAAVAGASPGRGARYGVADRGGATRPGGADRVHGRVRSRCRRLRGWAGAGYPTSSVSCR